jgi:hypothetical protein
MDINQSILFLNSSSFFIGAGSVQYTSTAADKPVEEPGYLIGYGTYIGKLRVEMAGKIILWEDFNQYQAELKRRFKKWDASLQWNHFHDYHEINARLGIRFSYWRIFRKRNTAE